ncbi:zinc finger protein 414 isoform X2 [Esox lucius]|uniref:zinc finger protein 414 isoform X2 n=1 Tax=Esox lucius TaxID=8010 RepID=UPI0010BDBF41|nr:zinc finger protein 414 isoform X2 [Esox lucius]
MSELKRLLSTAPRHLPTYLVTNTAIMSTGMASQLQPSSNTNQGQRMNCPLYGCQRIYADGDSLGRHIQDHQKHMPTQSLPGKGFLCSSIGCNGSFPSMQQLMEHMRQHHKPNTYFLCESCRSRLRSYRALLKHLHTCAKVAKSKAKAGQVAEFKPDPDGTVPMATEPSGTDQGPPQEPMESDSSHPAGGSSGFDLASHPAGGSSGFDLASHPAGGSSGFDLATHPAGGSSGFDLATHPAGGSSGFDLASHPAGGSSGFDLASHPAGGSSGFDLASTTTQFQPQPSGDASLLALDPSSSTFHPGASVAQPSGPSDQLQVSDGPYGSFSQYLQSPLEVSAPELQQTHHHLLQPSPMEHPHPRAPRPGLAATSSPLPQTGTPARSNARWRKNQGQSFNSRILWKHTRGRYSCVQCGHSTANRKEMTAHIKGQHKSPATAKPTNDTEGGEAPRTSQTKASSETESSTYTQL